MDVDHSIAVSEYKTLTDPLKTDFLKKYLYDFLYSKEEKIEDVIVMQSEKNSETFLFKGKFASQLLDFDK